MFTIPQLREIAVNCGLYLQNHEIFIPFANAIATRATTAERERAESELAESNRQRDWYQDIVFKIRHTTNCGHVDNVESAVAKLATRFDDAKGKIETLEVQRDEVSGILSQVLDAHYGTDVHHIGDGDGIPEFSAEKIRAWREADLAKARAQKGAE